MEDNPRHISILLKRMSVLYGFVIIQANGIPGYRLVGMASGSMSERVGGVLVVLQGLSWKVRVTLEGTAYLGRYDGKQVQVQFYICK